MIRRNQAVWAAMEELAARRKVSLSRLAIRSGQDSTAFNKSKRIGKNGAPRWPSTETIAKVLETEGVSFSEFGQIVDEILERSP